MASSEFRCTACGKPHWVNFTEYNKEVNVKCEKESCGYVNTYCIKGPISRLNVKKLELA